MPKNGIWFTTDPKSASEYAEENDSQDTKYDSSTRQFHRVHTASRVIPVYVRAVNPVYWEDWPDQIKYATNYKRAQGQLFDVLRSRGHDAIVFGTSDHSVIVVIGSPNQIKSATGNRGTFDASRKNIDEADEACGTGDEDRV
jgi:hypothetical protein